MKLKLKLPRPLDADDLFISYSREDGATYLDGLSEALSQMGFSCFDDRSGTEAGRLPPKTLFRRIRNCQTFVLLATPAAVGDSEFLAQEVRAFADANGTARIVAVSFDGGRDSLDDWSGAGWVEQVDGKARARELPEAVTTGTPSDAVLSRIEKQSQYQKSKDRLRKYRNRALYVLAFLVVTIAVASGVAWRQLVRAAQAMSEARAAQAQAQAAKAAADTARADATEQRRRAEEAAREALEKTELAAAAARDATEKARLAEEAAGRAKEAEAFAVAQQRRAVREMIRANSEAAVADIRAGANRAQSYLRQRPEDVGGSLSIALGAMKKAESSGFRNADADAALRESLALLPLRRGRVPVGSPRGVAFSPDGLHYATVGTEAGTQGLRVYEISERDGQDVTPPLLERDCDCTAVALDNGLAHAAAALRNGGGFKIFDLKDDSRSRVLDDVKGARGEKVASAEKLALSPDGRYLALSVDEGGSMEHSKLLVLDTESGVPAKIYDDDAAGGGVKDAAFGRTGRLDMLIMDVAFGTTGDLAIVGLHLGTLEGRAVIWHLRADAPTPGTPPRLNADSFGNYEVIPQGWSVKAVAPGADETYFATDKGVWKRPAGQTRFDPVARIPPPVSDDLPSVERIAFRHGGTRLVLARRDSTGAETVEVWDAAGYRSQAEAFHTDEVSDVGFEPGGRLVAALTGRDSKDVKDGPEGENRAHRLRVYQTDTGAKVAAPEPRPEDSDAFYVGPDAAQIVTLSGDTARVWDVWAKGGAGRPRVAAFGGAFGLLKSVGLSPGGRFLAVAGHVGDTTRVVVYRSDGGDYAEVMRFGFDRLDFFGGGLNLSADGRRLAVFAPLDRSPVRVFDDGVENMALRQRLDDLDDVNTIALSPNGRYLVVSESTGVNTFRQTGRTRLLDTSATSWETLLDDEHVTAVAFSPDGAYLGLGSEEGVLHVFETAKAKDGGAKGAGRGLREEIARLRHEGSVTAIAFSYDGRYVATASTARGLQEELLRDMQHVAFVTATAGDGRDAATASNQPQPYESEERRSYPLRVWPLRPAELIQESKQRLEQVKPPGR